MVENHSNAPAEVNQTVDAESVTLPRKRRFRDLGRFSTDTLVMILAIIKVKVIMGISRMKRRGLLPKGASAKIAYFL